MVIDGVHKWLGKNHILRGVNIAVASGEIVCVLGLQAPERARYFAASTVWRPLSPGPLKSAETASDTRFTKDSCSNAPNGNRPECDGG
ncbi:hypothetical protein AHiyo8_40930 [Arthrobacter sp. Hiyo8]|nr:hypothetical protein AHiyo8_40930 [Arthrobacter sp. Hiyo8]